MCVFFSFLGFKNGDFFHAADVTDSHEPMIRACRVNDSLTAFMSGSFFRGEFTPPADLKTLSDLSTWKLRVDENSIPDWYDEEKTRAWCERQLSPMFIHDARKTILGGCWILDGENASLSELVHGKIAIVANGANLYGANLYGANLSRASLYGANLSRADLYRADLDGANLDGANLDGATLYGANLDGANLSRANLDGANLSRANLYRANLDGANLDGAKISEGQALPKGWKRIDSGVVAKDE